MPGTVKLTIVPDAYARWLRTNVHQKACLLDSTTLLTEATGKPLDAAIFKRHLTQRYLG